MTRAAHVAGMDAKKKLQEIARKILVAVRMITRLPTSGSSARACGPGTTLAKAAQRAIDLGGPDTTVTSCRRTSTGSQPDGKRRLVGQGLMGVAKDNYPRDGQSRSFVAGFAEVEIDVNRQWTTSSTTSPSPTSARWSTHVPSAGHSGARYSASDTDRTSGSTTSSTGRGWRGGSITPAADDSDAPERMAWAALDIPDPETPVGARGIGEGWPHSDADEILLVPAAGTGAEPRSPRCFPHRLCSPRCSVNASALPETKIPTSLQSFGSSFALRNGLPAFVLAAVGGDRPLDEIGCDPSPRRPTEFDAERLHDRHLDGPRTWSPASG